MECVELDDCPAVCTADVDEAVASCLAALAECGDDGANITTCFEGGDPGDDACAMACIKLDECGYCIPDEADECLSIVDCAAGCREDSESIDAACVNAIAACPDDEAVEACLDDGDEMPPDEDTPPDGGDDMSPPD